MYEAYQPFLLAFFVLAAVGAGASLATLVTLVQERRHALPAVVPISAAHPKAAAITRRAA